MEAPGKFLALWLSRARAAPLLGMGSGVVSRGVRGETAAKGPGLTTVTAIFPAGGQAVWDRWTLARASRTSLIQSHLIRKRHFCPYMLLLSGEAGCDDVTVGANISIPCSS